jgi:pyruvate/2-oxoglutarate dehydrogenase complex dihydrolipoamide acyltransferase (E2) component
VDSQSGDSNYNDTHIPKVRRNVIDMIRLCAVPAIPAYLFYDIDMTWVEDLRKKFSALGYKTTVTAILLKAIAIAQRAHPIMRTALLPTGQIITMQKITAGFTVERFVNGEPGVFFGTIKEADSKPITEIADELRSYSEDEVTENSELELQHWFNQLPGFIRRIILFFGMNIPTMRLHYMGATFGLSSLGKFGAKAIIPPAVTTATFGIGQIEERPVARNGKVEIRPICSLILNFDHRVVDGAPCARFMQDVIKLLQGGLEEHIREELDRLSGMAPTQNPAFLAH